MLVALRTASTWSCARISSASISRDSFALGDGDAYSDLDFVVVTPMTLISAVESAFERDARPAPRPARRPGRSTRGSYAPAPCSGGPPTRGHPALRPAGWMARPVYRGRPPGAGVPFLFLGNGSRTLVRSEHDNTNVVRWVLREHGIALHGPPAAEVIDPVESGALAADVRQTAASFANTLLSGETTLEALHLQCFTVLFYCRVLQSFATGRIPSKAEAMRWALVELGPRWAPLIEDAWRRRSEYPRGRGAPALHAALHPSAAAVAETLAFVRLALDRMGPAAKGA